MSLDATSLQSALEAFFAAPPATAPACAERWASILGDYAGAVVPTSTTAESAATALESSLATAFASAAAAPGFDAALTAFAAALGVGMAPLYTGAPPPAPLGVAALLVAPAASHAAAAASFAGLIDAWFRTGSATLVAPPNTLVFWS